MREDENIVEFITRVQKLSNEADVLRKLLGKLVRKILRLHPPQFMMKVTAV